MATAQIFDKVVGTLSRLSRSKYPIAQIINPVYNSVIKGVSYTADRIRSSSYAVATIADPSPKIQVAEVLPFRVRLTNIGIEGYGPNNPPPIGIAIIGVNNYIL